MYVLIILTLVSRCFVLETTPAAPSIANKTPKKSCLRNFSSRSKGARIVLDIKVVVPRGAIVDAGANP